MKDIVIVGSSGFAREVKWLIDRINSTRLLWNFVGFIDSHVCNDGVIGNDEYLYSYPKELNVAVAIADTNLRRRLVALYKRNSLLAFPNLIDPSVIMSNSVKIGEGNIICAGSILTIDIDMCDFCIVNLDCTIGHGTVLNSFITMNPSVNVSGQVHLCEGASIGTGTQIIQGRCIGMNSIKIGRAHV